MISNAEANRLLFHTIGWPIGSGTTSPPLDAIEELTEYAFKNRVGLLFLDRCKSQKAALGPKALGMHQSLMARREATDAVVVKLARRLDEIARGEWVLFKSIKPFASTPNDTDWFPLDRRRHGELCDHLISDGQFSLLEVAPRQTTLIEASGEGVTDTTKRGGVYYIDCYVIPSTDYFVYLDSDRLREHTDTVEVLGYSVPILAPHAELAAIMFHNVFPERSFSIESYYLIKSYLDLIEEAGTLGQFVRVCRDQKMELAAACNLAMTSQIDLAMFNAVDARIVTLLEQLGHTGLKIGTLDLADPLPFDIPNRYFWGVFVSKLRDRTSLASAAVQLLHMLNPVFFADVVRIIWRRSVRGGVYEQN